jgi:phosphohistidine phosphatase
VVGDDRVDGVEEAVVDRGTLAVLGSGARVYPRPVRLYLIRHAEAERGEPDELRRLTHEGREAARRLGEELSGEGIGLVLASPLLRARETAELIAKAFGASVEVDERLAPGAALTEVRAAVAGRGDAVAVVGHQPDCSNVAVAITGRDPGFPAAGMARLDLPA